MKRKYGEQKMITKSGVGKLLKNVSNPLFRFAKCIKQIFSKRQFDIVT